MGQLCDRHGWAGGPDGARVTPGATDAFRSFFRLHDLDGQDDPEALFRDLVALVKWRLEQDKANLADLDAMLTYETPNSSIRMGLLMHLATLDGQFHALAKRMAARTIVKPGQVPMIYREMAAALLVSDGPPQLMIDGLPKRRPALARQVVWLLAVFVLADAGIAPTESSHTGRSGCARVAAACGLEYKAIEKVWAKRLKVLVEAGFPPHDIATLFADHS